VRGAYVIRPKADRDLDDQAYYLATEASPEVGHRFLLAAHETFGLLAANPKIGWHARLKHAELAALRVFRITGFEKILVFYRPHASGVEILRVAHASRNLQVLLRREGIE
jgi:toxin ParE1/3/4